MDGAEGNRYVVRSPSGEVTPLGFHEIRESIRRGVTTAVTLVAPAGTTTWRAASTYPELQSYLHLARTQKRRADTPDEMSTVTPARLIVYLALAGIVAAKMMSFMAPLCLVFGVFARFVLTTATLGAVLGVGINSAFRENDPAVINIPGVGFAAGGAIAWLFNSGAEFRAIHLAIIGVAGAAALAIALRLPLNRAAVLAVSGAILFPLSIALVQITWKFLPAEGTPLLEAEAIGFVVQGIPFALFGAVLGAVIAFTPGARTHGTVTA